MTTFRQEGLTHKQTPQDGFIGLQKWKCSSVIQLVCPRLCTLNPSGHDVNSIIATIGCHLMQHNPSDAHNDTLDTLSQVLRELEATISYPDDVTPPSSLHAQRCLCGIVATPGPGICLVYACSIRQMTQSTRPMLTLLRHFAKLKDLIMSIHPEKGVG